MSTDVRSAMGLPERHMRVVWGTCQECGHLRPYGIAADKPYMEGEESMDMLDFLNFLLDYTIHYHSGKTEAEYQLWKATHGKKQ